MPREGVDWLVVAKAACGNASAGPWVLREHKPWEGWTVAMASGHIFLTVAAGAYSSKDGAFIAEARHALPKALAVIDAADALAAATEVLRKSEAACIAWMNSNGEGDAVDCACEELAQERDVALEAYLILRHEVVGLEALEAKLGDLSEVADGEMRQRAAVFLAARDQAIADGRAEVQRLKDQLAEVEAARDRWRGEVLAHASRSTSWGSEETLRTAMAEQRREDDVLCSRRECENKHTKRHHQTGYCSGFDSIGGSCQCPGFTPAKETP